jgi:hypothetical protein
MARQQRPAQYGSACHAKTIAICSGCRLPMTASVSGKRWSSLAQDTGGGRLSEHMLDAWVTEHRMEAERRAYGQALAWAT